MMNKYSARLAAGWLAAGRLAAGLLAAALWIAGCSNPGLETSQPGLGLAVLRLAGSGTRTLLPAGAQGLTYKITCTSDNPDDTVTVDNWDGTEAQAIELAPGTWRISVTGFTASDDVTTGWIMIDIMPGQTTDREINLIPVGTGPGTLNYPAVTGLFDGNTVPASLGNPTGVLTLKRTDGRYSETIYLYSAGSMTIPPGSYEATVKLTALLDGGRVTAAKTELIHIYSTMTTNLTDSEVFMFLREEDFLAPLNIVDFTVESGVVTGYTGPGGAVSIPANAGIIAIGDRAFQNNASLTSVAIPEGVTSIGRDAFGDSTALESVTLPVSLTSIGAVAFGGCASLASVTIPASVAYIGESAFSGCTALGSIDIPASVVSIGDWVFSRCTALASITVDQGNPNYASDEGVLFNKTKTTLIQYPAGKTGSYTIPEGVTFIGDSAFYNCASLESVTLPVSLTSIGESAFSGCASLASVTIPASVAYIGESAFSGCTALGSIDIPASVVSIGDWVFSRCTALASITVDQGNPNYASDEGVLFNKTKTTLIQYPAGKTGSYTIPEGVTSIGRDAFGGCTALESVTLPVSLTSIEAVAFGGCTALASIDIPASVVSIGDSAFGGCSALETVTCRAAEPPGLRDSFSGCSALASIYVPADSLSAYQADTWWSRYTDIIQAIP